MITGLRALLPSFQAACFSTRSGQSRQVLKAVNTIIGDHGRLEVEKFREQAFGPAHPALITTSTDPLVSTSALSSIPAVHKWFHRETPHGDGDLLKHRDVPRREYLNKFSNVIFPYEYLHYLRRGDGSQDCLDAFQKYLIGHNQQGLAALLPSQTHSPNDKSAHDDQVQQDATLHDENFVSPTFYHFHAPLHLFLEASTSSPLQEDQFVDVSHILPRLPNLYIAQAQIAELPQQLQEDLPVPMLVKQAGKGDIYDANIWLGTAPTYTPLHKDPNPNLFVQLASDKVVRLFSPYVGSEIFHDVQQNIGRCSSPSFRGDEMMQGPERAALEEAVWDCPPGTDGFEVVVRPGDALFIPKGWWHSIKSVDSGITASVNWWFR